VTEKNREVAEVAAIQANVLVSGSCIDTVMDFLIRRYEVARG
jgi:hypothetical protein